MAAVRSSADQEIHPFAFVDYDEDDSEGEVRPLETTNEHQRLIQQALRSTTSANHHSLEQAMYPGQSDASTSSESVSPHTGFSRSFSMAHAQNYNPQFAEEQKYVSLKQDCAIRDTHRDWDRWGGGRSRPEASRFNVGNPNLMSGGFSWGRSADTARSHEPFPFPSVKDFGAYNMPRVQQPLYSATAAKTEPRPSVDGGQQSAMPALLTFAQENLELRAQIQSFSQEVVQLRAALKEQQAAAAREICGNEWKSRYWTVAEHQKFLEAVQRYGKRNFKAIAAHVGTRSSTQAKTHAQKYFARLERQNKAGGEPAKTLDSEGPGAPGPDTASTSGSSTTDSPPDEC
mmetsp:Transcript_50378/g.101105  ORF Transcript_50378/g.101105 Transcript_50378/m.101105 type:complete len:344 (-) Transcript_50378:103-1134(-)